MIPIFQWEWKKSMFDTKEHEVKRNQTMCTQKFDENWKKPSVRQLVQSRTQNEKDVKSNQWEIENQHKNVIRTMSYEIKQDQG